VHVRTRIKFCGCTSARDAEAAVGLGVDAIGVIFADGSPRRVSTQTGATIARAVPTFVTLVGVFVAPSAGEVQEALTAGYTPQFSGNESAQACESVGSGRYIKVFHVAFDADQCLDPAEFEQVARTYTRATWMLDTRVDGKHGGTGRSFDWKLAKALARERRVIISGGLTADNVGACIRALRPYGVDVRSGIETDGVKDPGKMRAFVRAVKEADAQA
jgi:phosphoribosylanthranilate isomerase